MGTSKAGPTLYPKKNRTLLLRSSIKQQPGKCPKETQRAAFGSLDHTIREQVCLARDRCDFSVKLPLKINGRVLLHFSKGFTLGFLKMVSSLNSARDNFILYNFNPYSIK